MSAGGGTISSLRMIGCFGTFRKALPYHFFYSIYGPSLGARLVLQTIEKPVARIYPTFDGPWNRVLVLMESARLRLIT